VADVICYGEEIQDLKAYGSSPHVNWESLDGALPQFMLDSNVYVFEKNQELATGNYRFSLYDTDIKTGCVSELKTITLKVAPAATTKIVGDTTICVGTTASYYTPYALGSTYLWDVSGKSIDYVKDENATSVRYVDWQQMGIDTITVYERTIDECQGFDTLIVKIANYPIPKFTWTMPGSTNILEFRDSTEQDSVWDVTSTGTKVIKPITYEIAWNFGHNKDDDSAEDLIVPYKNRKFPVTEGNYLHGENCPKMVVTNEYGCKASYKECVDIKISKGLYIPNAFSPNNPAYGVRVFKPLGFNLGKCEIWVFDVWGNLVWYSNDVKNGQFVGEWDGTYKGQSLKADTYVWKMDATFVDGTKWEGFDLENGSKAKFGSVILIK